MADEKRPLVERLRWIRTTRKMSGRSFARAAGLSPTYLNNILSGRVEPNFTENTIESIARAGNVRIAWLMRGELPREPFEERAAERQIDFNGRYPNLTEAIAIIKDELLPETIEFLRSKALDADADLSVSEWATDARLWDRAFRRKKKTGEEPGEKTDEEDVPPRGKR